MSDLERHTGGVRLGRGSAEQVSFSQHLAFHTEDVRGTGAAIAEGSLLELLAGNEKLFTAVIPQLLKTAFSKTVQA